MSKRVFALWLCIGFFAGSGAPFAAAQGFSPEEAIKQMTVPDGLEVKLFASEPMICQPVAMEFDDRGRLWVIQYLQYPNPAGLHRVKVDRYSRTVYDRIPEPPPRGPKGADRITILEDTDGDGRADRAKDFLSDLNLASGLAFGHGGVFVLNAPYLLFYSDRNHDDVPDSDPEVLLSGFGMEDAHSVANSLTWGPDGWLYGAQGSTVTAHIRGIEFQQGVWRYHPLTKQFELFFEGGGNMWGVDFDEAGQLFVSSNVGPPLLVHGVQGGYYWKSFGKHGALHNPYTFGYFEHATHIDAQGGHVTVGGIVYQGDAFPEMFRGKFIAANLLSHAVYWHDLKPHGSTFETRHAGVLLDSHDTWFAPCDVTMGPDGAVYVADWYDKRTAHPDPDAEWDRSNGRIYKILPKSGPGKLNPPPDLSRLASVELAKLLESRNDWLVRKARRLLADRRDATVIPALRKLALAMPNDRLALQALWALHVSGGFDEDVATQLLQHRDEHVRTWTVRLLGDSSQISSALAEQLVALAGRDPSVTVRSQLASTARRLAAEDGLPMVQRILLRNEDRHDPHLPLLLWWAVEHHSMSHPALVQRLFTAPDAAEAPMIREVILGRLMRRYAADRSEAGYAACARLLASATTAGHPAVLEILIGGLEQGLEGGALEKPPLSLEKSIADLWKRESNDLHFFRAAASLGFGPAYDRTVSLAIDSGTPNETRLFALRLLGEIGRPALVENLLDVVRQKPNEPVRAAALKALARFGDDTIATELLGIYLTMNSSLRSIARDLLFARRNWALAFLRGVDDGKFATGEVSPDQLRRLSLHDEPHLNALVRKCWGTFQNESTGEKLAEVRRLNNDLRAASGNPVAGHALFNQLCATCHRLFGEGNSVGPDLTQANRKDTDFLLVNVVDPSATIRKEYLNYIAETKDGRLLNGLIAEQTSASITLLAANGERTALARDQILRLDESPASLMPEELVTKLKPEDLRDLFSYLQSDGFANGRQSTKEK